MFSLHYFYASSQTGEKILYIIFIFFTIYLYFVCIFFLFVSRIFYYHFLLFSFIFVKFFHLYYFFMFYVIFPYFRSIYLFLEGCPITIINTLFIYL